MNLSGYGHAHARSFILKASHDDSLSTHTQLGYRSLQQPPKLVSLDRFQNEVSIVDLLSVHRPIVAGITGDSTIGFVLTLPA